VYVNEMKVCTKRERGQRESCRLNKPRKRGVD